MRYTLDILAILMVVPKVQLVLADTVEVLDETRSPVSTVGQFESSLPVQPSALPPCPGCASVCVVYLLQV